MTMYHIHVFAKKNGTYLLEPQNISIKAGVNLVLGQNGAGKSTLLRLLCGAEIDHDLQLSTDLLHFRYERLSGLEAREMRMLTQSSNNLFVASTPRRDIRLTAHLRGIEAESTLADHFSQLWPSCFHVLDTPSASISRGEVQKYFFALDSLNLVDISCFDELDAFCDDETVFAIFRRLGELHERACCEDKILLFATHFGNTSELDDAFNTIRLTRPASNPRLPSCSPFAVKSEDERMVQGRRINVSCTLPNNGEHVRLNFNALPGSTTVLNGGNGSGKTLLFRKLTSQLRKQMSLVFIPDWCADVGSGKTVSELLLGKPDSQSASALLNFPDSKLISDLSWGQRKIVNILQGMGHRPQLLIVDEPFAGLSEDFAVFLTSQFQRFLGKGGALLYSQNNSRHDAYGKALGAERFDL